ncbi:MAG TPA: phosphatase PAP2 family protein [Vicinamibacterales bacterium]|nr:phosphatase PAP2 family protein [Vicinamibacterales bacterium]
MWVVTHRIAPLDRVVWLLSVVGRGGMVWLAIGACVAIARRRVQAFTLVLLAVLIASAVTDAIIKPAVNRTRPYDVLPGDVIGGRPNDPSFPSGHSANAFAGAATLTRIAPEGAIAWWTLAAAIAFSRVYLGVHFPLDVIAGALIGAFSAWLAARLTRLPQL